MLLRSKLYVISDYGLFHMDADLRMDRRIAKWMERCCAAAF
jgi:hypothetical protein